MKKILTISLVSIVLLSGCNMMKDTQTKVTKETEELETDIKDDLDEMEEEAKEDINNKENITRDDINEATTYINEHINDPFKTEDITKKMYYYCSYIVNAADKKEINVENDLYTLASDTKQYIKNIYKQEKEKDDDTMTTLKTSIDQLSSRLDKEKDEAIDKFYDLIK